MAQALASLTVQSYVQNVELMASLAMANFLASEDSQTNAFAGNIANFPSIVQQAGHNMTSLTSLTRNVLEQYLSRIFDSAVVEVLDTSGTESRAKHSITIRALVSKDGRDYSLHRLLGDVKGEWAYLNAINEGKDPTLSQTT